MKHIAILGLFVLMLFKPAQAKFAPCPIGRVTTSHIRGSIRSVYPVISPENFMGSKTGIQILSGKKSTNLLLNPDTKFLLSHRAEIGDLKLDSNVILVGCLVPKLRLGMPILKLCLTIQYNKTTGNKEPVGCGEP